MSNLIKISGVRGYINEAGTVQLNVEDVARGLGFTKSDFKEGKEYVRINRQQIKNWMIEFGISNSEKDFPEFIPENIFYRLAMKAKNETAERFQALVADEILPSIRKHGGYLTPAKVEEALLNPDTINKRGEIMSNLAIIEYSGKRVLTTQQLAQVYETESDRIHQNFIRNQERFVIGRDYYRLEGPDLKEFKRSLSFSEEPSIKFAPSLILWTNRGANRHCKILDTDKAWQQFDVLEETYFRVKESNVIPFAIPKTLPEALRLAADLADQKDAAIRQLEEAKPQILFSQAVSTSPNSVLIGELAKILKQNGIEIGQNRLFEWLRQNEYLGKSGNNRNLPTQKAMKLGLFEIKKTTVSHSSGRIEVVRTPKVTGKGQIYIVEKFLDKKVSSNVY